MNLWWRVRSDISFLFLLMLLLQQNKASLNEDKWNLNCLGDNQKHEWNSLTWPNREMTKVIYFNCYEQRIWKIKEKTNCNQSILWFSKLPDVMMTSVKHDVLDWKCSSAKLNKLKNRNSFFSPSDKSFNNFSDDSNDRWHFFV